MRLSLAQQFVLLSLPILLAATLAMGWWVGREVQASALRRLGGVTALYVESFLAPHVQALRHAPELAAADDAALRRLMEASALTRRILAFKIWSLDGRVLFSSDGIGEGQVHPMDQGLIAARRGDISSHISVRTASQRQAHGQPDHARVIETYLPLRASGADTVIAVAESYQPPHELDSETRRAQWRSWLVVAAWMGGLYALLFALVLRGSRTIVRQRSALSLQLTEATRLHLQNEGLHRRVVRAAEQAVLVNESQLRGIAADVHDGPVQDLGLALMSLDEPPTADADRAHRTRAALRSALSDLRAICADIDLPALAGLSLPEVAARALRDFRDKSGRGVPLHVSGGGGAGAPQRVKVTLYRVLQEALANAHRHAAGAACSVRLAVRAEQLVLEVRDEGPGFDARTAAGKSNGVKGAAAVVSGRHLGLRGMRHRAALLRGRLTLENAAGAGAVLRVELPLAPLAAAATEAEDEDG